MHARFLDPAGPRGGLQWRHPTYCLPRIGPRRRPEVFHFVARWLACLYPCRRFDCVLAGTAARLGADVDRYSLHRSGLSPPTPRRFYPGAP